MLKLGRDPFARRTIRKRYVKTSHGCSWCGNAPESVRLFEIVIDADNQRESGVMRGVFCSMSCARAYHE